MNSKNQTAEKTELVIIKEFDAPKDMVFNAFTEAEALAQWWGPPGVPITVVKFDFRPKGIFHYKATMQGQTMWGKFVYGQIVRSQLLEFTSSFSDEHERVVRAPFSEQFPLEIFNHLEFSEKKGKTTLTLKGYPVNATKEEAQFFTSMSANMQQGFEGTFMQLENYLSKQVQK